VYGELEIICSRLSPEIEKRSTASGAHSASYPTATGSSFSGNKSAGA